MLEIGSYCGLSANLLTYFKRKHGVTNPLITCDKWEFQKPENSTDHVGQSAIHYKDLEQFARDSYIRNIRLFSSDDLPFTFEMNSDELFKCWQAAEFKTDVFGRTLNLGGPLSFCFVDGNHTYDYARRDFLNCDAFLQVGGFILFDDSTLEKDEVRLVMPRCLQRADTNLSRKILIIFSRRPGRDELLFCVRVAALRAGVLS